MTPTESFDAFARPWSQPGRLWSLWDMLKVDGETLVRLVGLINRLIVLSEKETSDAKEKLTDETSKSVSKAMAEAAQLTKDLGADVTEVAIREFIGDVELEKAKRPTYRELGPMCQSIHDTLRRELSLITLGIVAKGKAHLFLTSDPLFGTDVFDRFPVAIDDISEAGNCLALNRGTAAVFHLMRVMEAGLRALGAELQIPYAPSWEGYIGQLNKLLDSKNYDKLTPEQKAKLEFYQEVLGDLTSIKAAWRNPTMHIVRVYDLQQASVIFEAVKALMQALAKELNPDPTMTISTGQSF